MLKQLKRKLFRRPVATEASPFDADMEREFVDLYHRCKPFTMTDVPRMYALFKATEYICKYEIPGDVIECGVWKGGSAMLCALTLILMGDTSRDIYLYDTYAGMSEPTDKDIRIKSQEPAAQRWQEKQKRDHNKWCYAPLEAVKENLLSTGYPADKLHFVKGPVEETIPGTMPEQVALLRLDTDWYESTYHEMTHCYPKLVRDGILILDDYGHWAGARDAVDQYIDENNLRLFLNRANCGRIAVKTE